MTRCNIVFSYVDYDGCDMQFLEINDASFSDLSSAVNFIELFMGKFRQNRLSAYPYDSRTIKLHSFTAKEI